MRVTRHRFMARAASATACIAIALPAFASCGGDTLGVATTVVGVTPTAFATGTTTTLPENAVGQETTYTVVAGDSPISMYPKMW
ncbi:MAG: hypothetical protein ACKORY_04585, partial [Actinomycetota bacterium]